MDLSYQQLAEIIREKINSNEYVFGLALPSERELAKSFNVRRSLVRSAIEQLCTEGILKKYHGKGTYIMLKDIDDYELISKYTGLDIETIQKLSKWNLW